MPLIPERGECGLLARDMRPGVCIQEAATLDADEVGAGDGQGP
jgi:hypothetical protein